MNPDFLSALRVFGLASAYVRRAGLTEEVEWQRRANLGLFTESDFLREAAWVILCSGFRERTVRRLFDYISLCYCDWESAESIVQAGPACQVAAASVFRNAAKLTAISGIARLVDDLGFATFKREVLAEPIGRLKSLPYIGSITAWHLAKNLGMDAAKPDRHLQRLSDRLGFPSAFELCDCIAGITGEQAKVVDLVVWRYLADHPNEPASNISARAVA
jgi:hypothetical protein